MKSTVKGDNKRATQYDTTHCYSGLCGDLGVEIQANLRYCYVLPRAKLAQLLGLQPRSIFTIKLWPVPVLNRRLDHQYVQYQLKGEPYQC